MPTNALIADISNLGDHLLANYDIAGGLNDEQQRKIVEYVKAMHTMSYRRISKRYDAWDQADRAHDVYIDPDATDFREKAVIPDTRAIADTVITYLMAALTGRNPMFQLEGENRKSRKAAMILERVLHQGMRRTAGEAKIAQHLLDIVRYGYAPTKVVWHANSNQNRIINHQPRRTFPDPRVAWGDWDQMQFVVFTDFVTENWLYHSQEYPALDRYRDELRGDTASYGWDGHKNLKQTGQGLTYVPNIGIDDGYRLGNAKARDEIWFRVSGDELGLNGIRTIYLSATIVDEKYVASFRLNPYGQLLPAVFGGLFHDSHKAFSQSLYDLLLPLHDIATWLLRSRVDNVRIALNNLIFADPSRVSIPDLIDRNSFGIVRTLPGTQPGEGVYIAEVPDVTRGHWSDIAALSDMKQRVSSASDAQQGMPTPDVRTATEIQRLTQLGSQRLGVTARIISATTMRPMVRMMVSNIQDSLAMEGSLNLGNADVPPMLQSSLEDGYLDYNVNDLQGDISYLVIDGTLPLEPTRNAETWLNMLQILNQSGMMMEFRSDKIVEEAIRSMGISDLDQFRIPQQQQGREMTPSQQMAIMEKMRGANVQSNEQVQREVEKGNLIPLSQARITGGRSRDDNPQARRRQ